MKISALLETQELTPSLSAKGKKPNSLFQLFGSCKHGRILNRNDHTSLGLSRDRNGIRDKLGLGMISQPLIHKRRAW